MSAERVREVTSAIINGLGPVEISPTQRNGTELPPTPDWSDVEECGPRLSPLVSVSATDLVRIAAPKPQALIERILHRGLTVFHGRPKCGKSWFALQVAIGLARGETIGGTLAVKQPCRVLFLALEEQQWRTSHRIHELTSGAVGALDGIAFVYQVAPLLAGGAAQIADYLAAHEIDVLIIDTRLALMQLAGSKGNVVQADYNAWRTIQDIGQRFNLAVIVIDHSRKGQGDITESMVGTTGGAAAVDCLWRLKRLTDGRGEFEVLGRETEAECFELTFSTDPGSFGWQITAEGSEVGMSEERTEIVELLRAEGALKPARIAGLLKKNAVTVRRLLMKLSYHDAVRRNSDGTYHATGEQR